jgi:hypothetical protein
MSDQRTNYRRDNLKTSADALSKQLAKSISKNLALLTIKCRVVGQYMPGEQSPFKDDYNLDPNQWQVTVIPEDSYAQSYAVVLKDKSFTVRGDPDVLMQTYGSHGMVDKVVNLHFNSLNIRATGEVSFDAVAGFGVNKFIDTIKTVVAKAADLSIPSLFP